MRASAAAAFPRWLAQFEGDCRDPYLDVYGLPTVGLAFLCPLTLALSQAWTLSSGGLATPADIRAGYAKLCLQPKGMGGGWYRSKAGLTLTPHSYAVLLASKLASFEGALRSTKHVGDAWDGLPAVAQVARMRTAWADGGGAIWPKLDAALREGRWNDAADESAPGDLAKQPREYGASYRAVADLYRLAGGYPGDELPLELPDGSEVEPAV